jgi:hypothetical protein
MRTAKVVVISISGFNKKTFKSGDTVNENQFPTGRFDELLKGKYIELTGSDDKPVNEIDAPVVEIIAKEEPVLDEEEVKQKQDTAFRKRFGRERKTVVAEDYIPERKTEVRKEEQGTEEDTTVIELRAKLEEAGVKYNKDQSKEELYKLYRKHVAGKK